MNDRRLTDRQNLIQGHRTIDKGRRNVTEGCGLCKQNGLLCEGNCIISGIHGYIEETRDNCNEVTYDRKGIANKGYKKKGMNYVLVQKANGLYIGFDRTLKENGLISKDDIYVTGDGQGN